MTQRSGAVALAASVALAACATAPAAPHTSSSYADALVGRYANLRQDHEAAAERYTAALRRNPSDDAVLNGAITASMAAGDEARARQITRQAPREGAPALVHIVRAADALTAGRGAEAERQLLLAEGPAAQELISHMVLVWARAQSGRVNEVLVDLRQLSALRQYGALFAYQQAMALDLTGRGGEAIEAYRLAEEGELWLAPAIERHADLLARSGERDEAMALLRAHVDSGNPGLEAASTRLANGQQVAGNRLTAGRGAATAVYGLALLFQQENDRANALTAFTVALMLDPELDLARIARARAHAAAGNLALARADLARIAPSSAYAVHGRITEAWMLVDAGQEDAGLAIVRADADGGSVAARRTLADLYRRAQRYQDAEPIYTSLITENGETWRLLYARGVARERLDRWPEAETDLRRALELGPNQPEVLNYLGYTLIERGENSQEALVLVRRAAELRPNSGAILDSLAWAYFNLGDYTRALEVIERALVLEPGHPVLNDHLGDIYWRLGRRTEARFQWRRAVSLGATDAAAIEAKIETGLPDPSATR